MTPTRTERVAQHGAAFRLRGVRGNLLTCDEREAGQHPPPPRGLLSPRRAVLVPLYLVDAVALGLPPLLTTAKTRMAARRTSATSMAATMQKNQIALMTLVIPCEIPQIAPLVLVLPRSVLESSREPSVQLLGVH